LATPRTFSTTGFTGGEPLLEWRDFIGVLETTKDLLPDTAIHVLSNGRAFARSDVVAAWTGVKHRSLMVGIPLYAAVNHIHNYVVQADGAFEDTVLGILKLKDRGGRVELRVVLHAITVPRLVETSRCIARNLPFVDHVALMGLGNTGFAIANDALLWIDPMDYQVELAESVMTLANAGLHVSVYNLPLCVVSESIRAFARRSISDWKNGYGQGRSSIPHPRTPRTLQSVRPARCCSHWLKRIHPIAAALRARDSIGRIGRNWVAFGSRPRSGLFKFGEELVEVLYPPVG
jgi:His-Xaa-Ser system radical SAM maturase HxsC